MYHRSYSSGSDVSVEVQNALEQVTKVAHNAGGIRTKSLALFLKSCEVSTPERGNEDFMNYLERCLESEISDELYLALREVHDAVHERIEKLKY